VSHVAPTPELCFDRTTIICDLYTQAFVDHVITREATEADFRALTGS
jgi:hypothetical protein